MRWPRGRFRSTSQEASSHATTTSPPSRRGRRTEPSFLLRISAVTLAAAALGWFLRSQQEDTSRNPIAFVSYLLASKERVSSTSSIFTLQPARSNENHAIYESAWRTGIWSVTFKQPQLQIGRDYTPLPPFINTLGSLQISAEDQSTRDGDERLRFLIRREPHGEVSRYLHGLEIGTEIEIRGPNMEYEISVAPATSTSPGCTSSGRAGVGRTA
jgi:homoaconitate hydratase